jgi:hypothetical protein
MGLAGDNEQLSDLDAAPLSPEKTNIQMEIKEEEMEVTDDEQAGSGGPPPSYKGSISLNNDPATSGTFDAETSRVWRCWKASQTISEIEAEWAVQWQ